jgi:hypothetical protein
MDIKMARSHGFARLLRIIFSWGLLLTLMGVAPAPAPSQSQQNSQPHGARVGTPMPDDSSNTRTEIPEAMSAQQRQSIMRANFEKSKSDAAELAALAKGLREELDKPNINVLSPDVISRADKIERLAKKIRDETKGY